MPPLQERWHFVYFLKVAKLKNYLSFRTAVVEFFAANVASATNETTAVYEPAV